MSDQADGQLLAAVVARVDRPKALRLVVRVYNNALRERREATGRSACGFAEAIGVQPSTYCRYEALAESPLDRRTGRWKASALKIAEALHVLPADVFPEAALMLRVTRAERRVDAEEVAALIAGPPDLSPLGLLEAREELEALNETLSVLSSRERQVVIGLFGLETGRGRTLDELGGELGVSRERVDATGQGSP